MAERADWQAALGILRPLEVVLQAAEARGGCQEALQTAFEGAYEAVRVLATEAPARCGLTRVHGVLVEFTALPLVARDDGTLVDNGTYVSLEHQQYEVTDEQAAVLATRLSARLSTTSMSGDIFDSA